MVELVKILVRCLAAGQHQDGDNEENLVLQTVKVKQTTYKRWKPVSQDSIEIVSDTFAAAIGWVCRYSVSVVSISYIFYVHFTTVHRKFVCFL